MFMLFSARKVSGADFMTEWVNCHIKASASLGKPLILEEVRPALISCLVVTAVYANACMLPSACAAERSRRGKVTIAAAKQVPVCAFYLMLPCLLWDAVWQGCGLGQQLGAQQ